MSITPIEMYTMVPKSQEATVQRHNELSKAQNQQAEGVQHMDKNIADNSRRTVGTAESSKSDYRYDAKEKGNGSYQGFGDRKKDKNKEQKPQGIVNTSRRPGGIDIKI